jgi:hypothetical protein
VADGFGLGVVVEFDPHAVKKSAAATRAADGTNAGLEIILWS